MVPAGLLRNRGAQRLGALFVDRLERGGIPRTVPDRDHSRIWACAGLPPGWRTSRSDTALALWRRCLRESATTSRGKVMEYRSRAAGKCGACSHHHARRADEPSVGLVRGRARPAYVASLYFLDRYLAACVQHSPHLPARWRSNPSVFTLVCDGPRSQSTVGHRARNRGHRRLHRVRVLDA